MRKSTSHECAQQHSLSSRISIQIKGGFSSSSMTSKRQILAGLGEANTQFSEGLYRHAFRDSGREFFRRGHATSV